MAAAKSEDNAGPGEARLKLRARDPEDLQAIAVCLQDAIVPMAEIAYLEKERRFVLIANRFRWEVVTAELVGLMAAANEPEQEPKRDANFEDEEGEVRGPVFERVHCGVCFDFVRGVRARGLDRKDRPRLLNLLTICTAPGAIDLLFSEGVEVRLEVSRIRCHIEDLGEPWPTQWRPGHPMDDAPEKEDAKDSR